jgi:uncharacterized protein YcfJ
MSPVKRYLTLTFNKIELNVITSYLGVLGVICAVLVSNNVGNDSFRKVLTVIGGLSGGIVSLLINKPAAAEPTTYTLEHQNTEDDKLV